MYYSIHSDTSETPAERKKWEIKTLQWRIALGLAGPERMERRSQRLAQLLVEIGNATQVVK